MVENHLGGNVDSGIYLRVSGSPVAAKRPEPVGAPDWKRRVSIPNLPLPGEFPPPGLDP